MIQLVCITVFLIYMNVPAVLVSEYGVPRPLAALVPLLLVVPVGYRVLLRGEALRVPGMIIAALIMLACRTLSALFSERPDIGLESVFSWLLEGVLLAFLLLNALHSRDDVFAAARAIVAAGALMGLVVLIQQILGPQDYGMAGFGQLAVEANAVEGEVVEKVQYQLSGPIGEQNRFAQVLAVLIPLSAGLAFAAPARQRWPYWTATALIFAGVLLTFSRGALVALVLVLPFALVFGFLRLRHLAVAAICGALLLAVLPFMIAMPYFADRVASIGQVFVQFTGLAPGGLRNTDGASRGRIASMQAAGLLFLDHPVLGAGPGMSALNYGKYAKLLGGKVRAENRRAHNLYLEQAAETGVVGLLALFGMLWMVMHALNDTRRRTRYSDRELWGLVCGLQLGVLVYLTTSLFLHASYVRYFWLLLALAVAAATIPRPQMLTEFLSLIMRDGRGRLKRESSAIAVEQSMVRGGSA